MAKAKTKKGKIPECAQRVFEENKQSRVIIVRRWPTGTSGGPRRPFHDRLIRFLAGKDQADDARRLWADVEALSGTGEAFEVEAAHLLYAAVFPGAHHFTRAELRDQDSRVAELADELIAALAEHPELSTELSSRYWTEEYAECVRKLLRGVPCEDWSVTAWVRDDDLIRPPAADELMAWVVAKNAPLMWLMLEKLRDEARALANSRMEAKKRRQNTSEAPTARTIRQLATGLLKRHPHAPDAQLAQIVAPIAEIILGVDSILLGRVEKQIQRLRRQTSA
jgi:hypothetical protein